MGPADRLAAPTNSWENAGSDEDRPLTGEVQGDERRPTAASDEISRLETAKA
ncbi:MULTISPECIES: hypothetical protein [Bacillales]|uniref:hypothetical protein n=1 Tax=Brevibacillus TaxID=55080 RepID=UPI0014931826|nr:MULTISPECIES: hypothetical protein [Bacillales]MBR8658973.1 hypothetical protein [Brevibacillus sp. NL20B1]MDT3417352.1 hypothetical protein [Brevibacillus aydinogluensis]UFJ59757.1 hypothetical protein IRT44_10455 [Anoxybacillus sediminis]